MTDTRPHGYRAIREHLTAIRSLTRHINIDAFLDGLHAAQDTGHPATTSGANSGGTRTTTMTRPERGAIDTKPDQPLADLSRARRLAKTAAEALDELELLAKRYTPHHAPTHVAETTPTRDLVGEDGNPIFCRQCLEQGSRNPVDPKRPETGECRLHAEWRLNPPPPWKPGDPIPQRISKCYADGRRVTQAVLDIAAADMLTEARAKGRGKGKGKRRG